MKRTRHDIPTVLSSRQYHFDQVTIFLRERLA